MFLLAWFLGLIGHPPTVTTFEDVELQAYTITVQTYVERLCSPTFLPILYVDWMGWKWFGDAIGVSTYWLGAGFSHITIDKEYWDTHSERYRFLLMAHELNHSWFDAEHTKEGELMSEHIEPLDINIAIGTAFARECVKQGRPINYVVLLEGPFAYEDM